MPGRLPTTAGTQCRQSRRVHDHSQSVRQGRDRATSRLKHSGDVGIRRDVMDQIKHELDIAGAARARICGTASRAQNAEPPQHYCDVLAHAYILLVKHVSDQLLQAVDVTSAHTAERSRTPALLASSIRNAPIDAPLGRGLISPGL